MRAVRTSLVVIALLLSLAACGGDDDAQPSSTASSDELNASAYCERAVAYAEATDVDVESVDAMIASFSAASRAARALADVAPADLQEAHERIARAAEELVAGIVAGDPQTQDELFAVGEVVTAELEAKYGDLEAEVEAFGDYAESECGLTPDGA